jgi:hypothetical protein
MIRATNAANVAPVPAPAPKVCFQFMYNRLINWNVN